MLSNFCFEHAGSIALLFASSFILSQVIRTLPARPWQSKCRHIPCPTQGFFLFRVLHEPTVRQLEDWLDKLPHNGLIRYYGLWNQERIFAASPGAVKDLLVTEAYKFVKPELQHILADNIASKGLLIQEGQVHKAARKAFQPAFHANHIRRAYPIMWESAFDLANAVSIQSQTRTVEVKGDYNSCASVSLLKPICAASIDIIG